MSWRRGLMVLKRVSMKKTNTGYSIHVFVSDGEVASALRQGIDRFFAKLELQRDPDRSQRVLEEVNDEEERIKESAVVKDAY